MTDSTESSPQLLRRSVAFKVIGKTTDRGFFGTKYYLALKLIDHEVFGDSVGRTFTRRARFDQYSDLDVGDEVDIFMESEDGSYWRFARDD